MFYSQFILAKKGPLGTIWIAAHLERKLRKNQVADTDIGVSVDSILFPDVPIALRLSSHLLLGVVKIYSRKVNYLFDDCSDALLKIKQAFRSTAVDLPPEESMAPYHSITLPETFDLDDFELPDNDLFQGNYVDHHVSTKEQITLQDSMEGAVYPSSQFGLDERFGDGDGSQINLELDEVLLFDKVDASGHVEVAFGLDTDVQASVRPTTPLKIDEINKGTTETSDIMPDDGNRNQIHGLPPSVDLFECADAPETPGLVEEPSLVSVQQSLDFYGNVVSVDHNSTGLEEHLENSYSNSEHHLENKNALDDYDMNIDHVPSKPVEENINSFVLHQETKNMHQQGDSACLVDIVKHLSPDYANVGSSLERADILENGVQSNDETNVPLTAQSDIRGEEPQEVGMSIFVASTHEVFVEPNSEIETIPTIPVKSVPSSNFQVVSEGIELLHTPSTEHCIAELDKLQPQPSQEQTDSKIESCAVPIEMSFVPIHVLQPCGLHLKKQGFLSQEDEITTGISSLPSEHDVNGGCSVEGVNEKLANASGSLPEVQGCDASIVRGSHEANQVVHSKLDEQIDNFISGGALGDLNKLAYSDFPAPEKMLSVLEGPIDVPSNFLIGSTQDKEIQVESENNRASISGKKRSLEESMMSFQSLKSSESFGMHKFKRTEEFIPADDDLLSSILVGRKSSVLKLWPTPLPEVVRMKCVRSQTRPYKRKVLIDDSMILHGDAIRQQLISTEDIRRVRKKAPCTRPEIWTIQKQFLEEEIFSEPISTGMSAELIILHGQTFDLSRIKISKSVENVSIEQLPKALDPSPIQNVNLESEREGEIGTPIAINYNCDDHVDDAQLQVEASIIPSELGNLQNETLHDLGEMVIEKEIIEVSTVADHMTTDLEVFPTVLDKATNIDASLQIDGSCTPHIDCFGVQSIGSNAHVVDINDDNVVLVGTKFVSRDDIFLEKIEPGYSREDITDVNENFCVTVANVNDSLANLSLETSVLNISVVVTDGLVKQENGNNELDFVREDVIPIIELDRDRKSPQLSQIHDEESKLGNSYSTKLDVNLKNVLWNDGENLGCNEAEAHKIDDARQMVFDPIIEGFEDNTEFLNVDDEDVVEGDNGKSESQETQRFESSRWSSRTRAVAKYLRTIFEKQSEKGKTVLPIENLLMGKTRKEASRMFFETLVLKTRDYIHIEQSKPFDKMTISPQEKLIKSDF